jgi:hypothetical protein
MHITKKIDRAFQWAGEKMGQEAKTGMSDEFKMLETEMALRHDGMQPYTNTPKGCVWIYTTMHAPSHRDLAYANKLPPPQEWTGSNDR